MRGCVIMKATRTLRTYKTHVHLKYVILKEWF